MMCEHVNTPPIPRIIHLCDETYPRTDSILHNMLTSFQQLNPTYEINFMDETACSKAVRDFSEELFDIYKQLGGPAKADIWRIIMLYTRGGIYADLDVECLRPLDALLEQIGDAEVAFAKEPEVHWENSDPPACNAFMVSRPGSEFWQRYIDEIKLLAGQHAENNTSFHRNDIGPQMLESVMQSNVHTNVHTNVHIIPTHLVYPLPDVSVFPHEEYERMIVNRAYGDAFVVHYWLHTDFLFTEDFESIECYLMQFFRIYNLQKWRHIGKLIKGWVGM
jgi:hypothetical protein